MNLELAGELFRLVVQLARPRLFEEPSTVADDTLMEARVIRKSFEPEEEPEALNFDHPASQPQFRPTN